MGAIEGLMHLEILTLGGSCTCMLLLDCSNLEKSEYMCCSPVIVCESQFLLKSFKMATFVPEIVDIALPL